MASSKIIVVGSLNADLVATVDRAPSAGETVWGREFQVFSGGKGANQAYAAACLGGQVAMVGRVGEDDYGRQQIRNLSDVGVAVEGVRPLKGVSTGIALIIVEASGENRIVAVAGANGRFAPSELDRDLLFLDGAKLAMLQLEIPVPSVLRCLIEAKGRGLTTILDPAPAPKEPLPSELLEQVDYLTPNVSELRALSGADVGDESGLSDIAGAARSLLKQGATKVVAKLGPRGVLLVSDESERLVEGWRVKAVDTTAAGDCFNGAFAAALAEGLGDEEAARFACAAAAVSVTRPGAQPSLPRLEEAQSFAGESFGLGGGEG